jgi:hypothetical protein
MSERGAPMRVSSAISRTPRADAPRSIVVVGGRTNPTENKRLCHCYDVPDGKSAKNNHQ